MTALRLEYPPDLPITAVADDLRRMIEAHQVVVVAGETGSGKSTQLPKIALAAGRGAPGGPMIGHTQPRRVAARTIAARLASECEVALGAEVGFAVRFDDRVGDATRVSVMTDGILLAELARDPLLARYDTLIIDEAHERSLNIDLLLGHLHGLLARRRDLKLIITSATIDTERFAAHFATADGTPAPVVEIGGRSHPVEVRYRPVDDLDQAQAICEAAEELFAAVPGDVLVFVSGEREIRDATDALSAQFAPRGVEVLALYARLSAGEQQRVFSPSGQQRRIIVATNVAETSVTVPGVRAVIDTGLARISRFSRRLKVQRLPIEEISQASANQRAGRCGRIGSGLCIRLYSEESFEERPEFTEPEILRTNLAAVILQMTSMGLGDPTRFGFLEAPDRAAWRDGEVLLHELGALSGDGGLTRTGRRLARLPVDPRLGRMILEADRLDCVREVLVIAAALSIRDVREFPVERRGAADAMHARFKVDGSDLLGVVALWDHLRAESRQRSSSSFRRMCRAEFLHVVRIREWQDLYRQLRRAAASIGITTGTTDAHPDHVHRAVLAGHLSQIGTHDTPGREYSGARGSRFVVAPGSAVSRSARWVMATELVETDRLRARRLAVIQPGWAESLGGHLVKRSYGEPRWDASRRRAMVPERVTLFGLVLADGRMVPADRADPDLARELYIRFGLLGDEELAAPQRAVADRAAQLAGRMRRSLDDDALFQFFDDRLGDDVTSGPAADRWWRDHAEDVELRVEDLFGIDDDLVRDYPDRWSVATGDEVVQVDLDYRFDPDSPLDGVLVRIPLAALNRIDGRGFDWQVRGHRPAVVEALVRSAPKSLRRRLIPLGDHLEATIDAVMARSGPETGVEQPPLIEVVADELSLVSGVRVSAADLDVGAVQGYLAMVFVVDGPDGVIDAGRDLGAIRARQARALRAQILADTPIEERSGIRSWDLGDLAREVTTTSGARAYPVLVDDGDSVSVRLLMNPERQDAVMRAGLRRLLVLDTAPSVRSLLAGLSSTSQLALAGTGFDSADLATDAIEAAVDRLMGTECVWDATAYGQLRQRVSGRVAPLAADALDAGVGVVAAAALLSERLDTMRAAALADTVADARAHLDRLVRARFILAAGVHRLADVARYLRGIEYRLDRLAGSVERDRARITEVAGVEERWRDLHRAGVDVTDVFWSLEELRVAVFAQEIGAVGKPSVARIERELVAMSTLTP